VATTLAQDACDRAISARGEAAARLQSAHTVDLYDFGLTADQTLYLVMELLDGMDLESLVRSTDRSRRRA
jgi:serine/threonine protein kinase